jgi:hypothetical protein
MESRDSSDRRLRWRLGAVDLEQPKLVVSLVLIGLLFDLTSAIARPTHGYGDLIDEFCISRGRLRIAGHQPHCGMCHQPGTFDDLPANRVEPNWTEFERGKTSGDFGYFCPGGTSTAPAQGNAPMAMPTPAPTNPAPPPAPASPPKAADGRQPMGMGMHGGEIDGGEMHGMGEMGRMRGRRQPAPSITAPAGQSGGGAGHPSQAAPPPSGMTPSTTPPSAAATSAAGVLSIDRQPVPKPEVEQRLTKFRNEIGIRDSQRARWDAFAEAVRSAAQRHEEVATIATSTAASGGDAVALLQTEQRHMSARIAALRYVSTAFTQLLSVLDEPQRKIANEQLAGIVNTL